MRARDGSAATPLASCLPTAQVLKLGDAAWLTADEQGRASAFRRAADRDDYVAAHLLVRLVAAKAVEAEPDQIVVQQRCPTCGGPHGPPTVADTPNLSVSMAHTSATVAAIAGAGCLAIDVERLSNGNSRAGRTFRNEIVDQLTGTALTAAEAALAREAADPRQAFLQFWVRKEAMVKLGRSRLDEFGTTDVSAAPLPQQPDGRLHRHQLDNLHLVEWASGHRDMVGAVLSDTDPEIVFDWPPDQTLR